MIPFLIDFLIIALLIAGRHHDPEVGPGRHTESADQPTDAPVSTPQHQPPGGWATHVPQHNIRSRVRPRELTSSEIPVWTTLDDHQLTRLLKQSSR